MSELFAIAGAVLLGVGLTLVFGRRFRPEERPFLWLSLLVHFGAAIFKVVLVYWIKDGVGDMSTYLHYGHGFIEFMSLDFGRFAPEMLRLTLQLEATLPFEPPGGSGTTRSMYGFTSLIGFFFAGSKWAISLVVATFSHLSKVALYRVFSSMLPRPYWKRIAVATLLIPSSALWSGALAKEGIAYMGFGWFVWGFWMTLERARPWPGLPVMVLGALPVALVKPYLLFPAVIGFAAWYYARNNPTRPDSASLLVQLARSVVAVVFAVALVIWMGEKFPRFALENLLTSTETVQLVGERASDAGSQYSLNVQSGVRGQLAAAPLGLLTALYRPLLFEARNVLALLNAFETTAFLLLTVVAIRARSFAETRLFIRSNPALVFSLVYVVLFAAAVGVSSTNLGTLSRYRMPMVPMFATLLLVLAPLRASTVRTAPARHRRRPRAVTPQYRRRLRGRRLRNARRSGRG